MTNEERDLITGLFNRLRSADNPQKDQEAVSLIQQATVAQPSAPYLLVQTVLVQEHALGNAQTRIQQLEKQLSDAQSGHTGGGGVGSFLSGLLGGHSSSASPSAQPVRPTQQQPQQPPPMPAQSYAQQPAPPYPSTVNMPPSAGGGFLRSALGTAAGVAGGAMLFEGIQNLLGHNAGPFAGAFGGGGGGFFGGGGGFGGRPEIIENREVVNNYYDERGSRDDGGSGSFPGNAGQEQIGFDPSQREDNRYDSGNSGDTDGNGPLYSTPPTDDPVSNSGDTDGDGPLYSTPPTDDADSGSMDNTYDTGNTDAGDSGGSNDDSSYV